jgi:hypothetical protein
VSINEKQRSPSVLVVGWGKPGFLSIRLVRREPCGVLADSPTVGRFLDALGIGHDRRAPDHLSHRS